MAPEDLLARLAVTLREDIGPAVGESYPRTQAFMASVVLEKLSRQIGLAPVHAAADRLDRAALAADLAGLVADTDPPPVREAVAHLAAEDSNASICAVIEALYAARPDLGPDRFDLLLGRVRRTSRSQLDRQLAYAT
jgi:hypothetical protein